MKTFHQIILCCLTCVLFNQNSFSQSPHIYILPTTAQALKLKAKGDLFVSAGSSTNVSIYGISNSSTTSPRSSSYEYRLTYSNFQLGYSLRNRFTLSLSYDKAKAKHLTLTNTTDVLHQSHIIGLGIGTYHPFKIRKIFFPFRKKPTTKQYRKFLIDLHLGYNRGNITNQYPLYNSATANLNLQKIYIQAGIHSVLGKYFDLSYMAKFGKINYLNGIINGKVGSDEQTIFAIAEFKKFNTWENTVKIEAKILKKMGLFFQWSNTCNFEFSNSCNNILHLGVAARFNDVHLKKKKVTN